MSASATPWVDTIGTTIPGRYRFLHYCAHTMNWRTGELRFRLDTCSRVTGLSKRTILYHSSWAQRAGLLEARRTARGKCNRYVLHVGRTPTLDPDEPCIRGPKVQPKLQPDCTSDCRPDCTSNPRPIAPEIAPDEPSKKNQEKGEPRERTREARDLSPAPLRVDEVGEGKQARRIEEVPAAPPERAPDNWQPDQADVETLKRQGYPEDMIPLLRDELFAMVRKNPGKRRPDLGAEFVGMGLRQIRWRQERERQSSTHRRRASGADLRAVEARIAARRGYAPPPPPFAGATIEGTVA